MYLFIYFPNVTFIVKYFKQAEDRAHRIGQKKQVVVFRFITEVNILYKKI